MQSISVPSMSKMNSIKPHASPPLLLQGTRGAEGSFTQMHKQGRQCRKTRMTRSKGAWMRPGSVSLADKCCLASILASCLPASVAGWGGRFGIFTHLVLKSQRQTPNGGTIEVGDNQAENPAS